MTNVDRYVELRDYFVELLVEHYKNQGTKEKTEENIIEIRNNMTNELDSVIDEIGIEDAIVYVQELIETKDEFFNMSNEIYNGTFDFKSLIKDGLNEVMGIKIGDILLREDEFITILCRVIGFTELLAPIVECLNMEYYNVLEEGVVIYKAGDILPYLYSDFENDKFI